MSQQRDIYAIYSSPHLALNNFFLVLREEVWLKSVLPACFGQLKVKKWSFYPSALCEQNSVHLTAIGSSVTRQGQWKTSSRQWSSHCRHIHLWSLHFRKGDSAICTHLQTPHYLLVTVSFWLKWKKKKFSLLCCRKTETWWNKDTLESSGLKQN